MIEDCDSIFSHYYGMFEVRLHFLHLNEPMAQIYYNCLMKETKEKNQIAPTSMGLTFKKNY